MKYSQYKMTREAKNKKSRYSSPSIYDSMSFFQTCFSCQRVVSYVLVNVKAAILPWMGPIVKGFQLQTVLAISSFESLLHKICPHHLILHMEFFMFDHKSPEMSQHLMYISCYLPTMPYYHALCIVLSLNLIKATAYKPF